MSEHWFAKYLDLPVDGPEHVERRAELWIGGSDIVCGYYLSMLTKTNYLAVSLEQRWDELRRYVLKHAPPEAQAFLHEACLSEFAAPFLKWRFDETFGLSRKVGKEERALVLLLTHPNWSDEQIRDALRTTDKQMRRWSTYGYARIVQRRYKLAK